MTAELIIPLAIGTKVKKISSKPFKSREKVNTIKDYCIHPKLSVICYTFEEDDSYVEARRCVAIDLSIETILDNILSNSDVNLAPIYGFYSIDYDLSDILKVISDIFHNTGKDVFQFNIKSGNLIKTFNVNIPEVFIYYLSKFNKDSRDWLIAEEGEYPEFIKED